MIAPLGRRVRRPARRRLGVEHELQLFAVEGQLDARAVLRDLPLGGRRLDPGDGHAVRCPWGGVITADGREVEIATPPVDLGDDGVGRTVALVAAGTAALDDALPDGTTMRGYSTHLNVEVDDCDAVRIGRTVVDRLAIPVMLMLDRRDSPGLLVRPRHRRLELGGEYQRDDDLRAALVMAAGIAMVAERVIRDRRYRRVAPPLLDLRVVPSPQRYGWFVDRRAGGSDLYSHGRATLLRTSRGTTVRAGELLATTWEMARDELSRGCHVADLALVDRVVSGRAPLPCESDQDDRCVSAAPHMTVAAASGVTDVLSVRHRAGAAVATVAATWHAVSLRAERDGIARWIDVPGERIEGFLGELDGGELDSWLDALLTPVSS